MEADSNGSGPTDPAGHAHEGCRAGRGQQETSADDPVEPGSQGNLWAAAMTPAERVVVGRERIILAGRRSS